MARAIVRSSLLPLRYVRGLLVQNGIVAVRQRPDEMIRVSRFRRSDDLLFRGAFASISDIIPDGPLKSHVSCKDHPEQAAEFAAPKSGNIRAVYRNLALIQLIEPHQQINERGFPAPVGPTMATVCPCFTSTFISSIRSWSAL